MKRTLVVLLALLLATVGCSGMPFLSSLFPTATPYPTQTPYPTLVPLPTYTPYPTPRTIPVPEIPTAAPAVVGHVRIVNNGPFPICHVYFSPSTDSMWGANRMGPNDVIAMGDSRDFIVTPGGQPYDFRVTNCEETQEGLFWAVPVWAAQLILTVE